MLEIHDHDVGETEIHIKLSFGHPVVEDAVCTNFKIITNFDLEKV